MLPTVEFDWNVIRSAEISDNIFSMMFDSDLKRPIDDDINQRHFNNNMKNIWQMNAQCKQANCENGCRGNNHDSITDKETL